TLNNGSSGSTIRGLAIHGFSNVFHAEIKITQSSNNLVAGNCLGTDGSGTVRKGGWAGVLVQIASANNTIGGTVLADRNVISGNDTDGVQIRDGGTNNNVVVGNYIGVNSAGTAAIGNTNHGVVVWAGASNNTIGGTTAAAANVISGNGGFGFDIHDCGVSGNVVLGNNIGTDKNGAALAHTSGSVPIPPGATG